MESNWVDFKLVKESVTIEQVLDRYGIKLKKSGKELRGRCPLHQGEGADSFHANTEKNAFHCFSCGAKGNVLDFVSAAEKCSIRDAALKLQSWFGFTSDRSNPSSRPTPPPEASGARRTAGDLDSELAREGDTTDQINKPLGFKLKGVDHNHPYLAQRGIDPQTAEYFGIGFFSGKGSMHGRIVIPIENERGELVAYAGRSIDGSEPKYKLPAGFKKSQVLYNLSRAAEETDGTVVVVEGFFDCINVTQAAHACVAIMGCSLSDEQERLLLAHFQRVILMLDGDTAGRMAAAEIVGRLVHKTWVRMATIPDGQQPDQLATMHLAELLQRL